MNKVCFAVVSTILLLAALQSGVAFADTLTGRDRAFFENKIRPVLVTHCYQCHSAAAKQVGGNLRLDSRDGVMAGGQSGPVLVAQRPEESLIIQALRYDGVEMPPDQPLSESVIRDFETWIRRGAADPRTGDRATGAESEVDLAALWSFFPRRAVEVPDVVDRSWPRDPIDRFVLARIEAAGLSPTHDADPRTLIRRLHYDLIGLPPELNDVDRFVDAYKQDAAKATRDLVDWLLNRPQFGQRWGRHWLDVARYGESNGDDGLGRNASFPHAWRYRDYVIDALNNDVPYDRFISEQICGDLLEAETAGQRNRQLVATGFLAMGAKPAAAMNKNFAMDIVDDQINAVSTAVMGLSVACARCHDHKHDPIPTRDYYALAGIFTSTETLYGLAANEKLTAPPTELHQLKSTWSKDSAVHDRNEVPKFPSAYAEVIKGLGPQLHAKLDVVPDGLSVESPESFSADNYAAVKTTNIHGKLPASDEAYSVSFWFKNDTPNDQRPITAYLFSRAKLGDKALPGDHLGIGGTHEKSRTGNLFVFNGNVDKKSVAGSTVIPAGSWNHVVLVRDRRSVKVFLNGVLEIETEMRANFGDSPDYCVANRSDKFAPLAGNLAQFSIFDRALSDQQAGQIHNASGQPQGSRTLGLAMGVREKPKPANCKIHIGGETGKLGEEVPRGFLTAYEKDLLNKDLLNNGDEPRTADLPVDSNQSGRRELAAWLTRPDHPQTARVMVNRVWMHLLGHGIVATPDDFGVYGARPTDPELLDHLAERFVRDGWSIKRLIRQIVLSRTYGLDSRCSEQLAAADPENSLFARHDRRRLDAESLRDSILAASGRLDVNPSPGSAIETIDALINWPPGESTNLHRQSNHRSIYLCMLRHAPPPELTAFDLPDGVGIVGRRNETTLPTQSLFLLNNPFVVGQAESLATEILALSDRDDVERIGLVFGRILQRRPSDGESAAALRHIRSLESSLKDHSAESELRKMKAWSSLCQALMASNEFRYID